MKAVRKIYTKSVRKLHKKFNPNHQPVPLPVFFKFKLLRFVCRTEKEKLSPHT